MKLSCRHLVLVLLACVLCAAHAQEFRATISGRVVDSTGAVIPHAAVTVTNTETGTKTDTVTSGNGDYTVPFLLPGKYSVVVNAKGFQRYVHDGITVQSGDKIAEDATMALGADSEVIHVTTDTPLLETASSTAGQVLTPDEIADLPDNGRSPLALAKTEFAVIPKLKNSVVQARPFDNSAASDFSVGGGASQSNEYLLDGIPNMQSSSRLPGFSPLQDSVAEIRVDVFQSDASYGDTSNGTIDMITKAGTNQFHGSLSEFNEFSAINAPNRWFVTAKQYASRQNQYGGEIGGPVIIPHLYNGTNKLFFLFAYEGFRGTQPTVGVTTVPTAAERQGDFSQTLSAGCPAGFANNPATAPAICLPYGTNKSNYADPNQLYNPSTAMLSGSNVVRTFIPDNCLTATSTNCSSSPNAGLVLNPVALAYLGFIPQPNQAGNADGSLNYSYAYNVINNYSSNLGRLDYSINDNNKIFFQTHRSAWTQTTGQIFPNISTGAVTYTVHQGGVFDFIHTFSPRYTLDTRAGITRTYINGTLLNNGFQASPLGYPSYLDQPGSPASLPVISFSESANSYQSLSSLPGANTAFDTVTLFSAFTGVQGGHTYKLGIDMRANKYSFLNIGNSTNAIVNGQNLTSGATSGSFTFGDNFLTSGTGAANTVYGASAASFLLGIPTAGSFNINPKPQYNNWYFAGFAQDDWRVAPTLTVNAGVRFESESSINESNNQATWWVPGLTNEVTGPAATAYAANPISQLPASSFSPTGGFQFASAGGRRVEYFTPKIYVSPRIGLAYTPAMLHNKVVLHVGYGLYYSPFNDYYTPQTYGFSSTVAYVPTNNNYLTTATTLSNPFPSSNPITPPTGSSLGVNTYLGQAISYRAPYLKGTYAERYYADFQYQFAGNWMLEAAYIGSRSVHLTYTNALSSVPQLPFLSRLPYKDTPNETLLTSSVTNPFKGIPGETGTLATASTISRFSLLQAYPEYASVNQQLVPGASSSFSELAVRVEHRLSHGLTVNFNYQYSKNLQAQQLNSGGPLTYQENASDFPNHVSLAGSYKLPIGPGHFLGGNTHGVVASFIGGWTVNAIYTFLSGAAIGWGGPGGSGQPYFTNGTSWDPTLKVSPRNIAHAVNQALFQPASLQPDSYNFRTFPLYFGRQDVVNNLNSSLLKDFSLGSRFKLQYRFETYNTTNHTQFGAPNVTPTSSSLGTITSQQNTPRVIQQGLRLVF
jgi:hypothetical protein